MLTMKRDQDVKKDGYRRFVLVLVDRRVHWLLEQAGDILAKSMTEFMWAPVCPVGYILDATFWLAY